MRIDSMTPEYLIELSHIVQNPRLHPKHPVHKGMLFLTPKDDTRLTPALRTAWRQLEREVIANLSSPLPLFWAREDSYLASLADTMTRSTKSSLFASYQVAPARRERQSPVQAPKLPTIHGWLHGTKPEGKQTPTIAIVSHLDTMGLVPGASVGAARPTSGVAAMLELIRVFSTLYANPQTRPAYNLLFVIAGGSAHNFAGVREWSKAHVHQSSLVEAVLCLDGLEGEGRGLAFHYPGTHSKGSAQQDRLVEAFQTAAGSAGVSMQMCPHGKLKGAARALPHLALPLRYVRGAATLGLVNDPQDACKAPVGLARADFLDTPACVSADEVVRRAALVGDALVGYMFGPDALPDVARALHLARTQAQGEEASRGVFGASDLSAEAIDAWMSYLCAYPRVAPYLDAAHPVVAALHKHFRDLLRDAQVETYRAPTTPRFYSPVTWSVAVHRSIPYALHLLITVCVAALNAGLFFFIKFDVLGRLTGRKKQE